MTKGDRHIRIFVEGTFVQSLNRDKGLSPAVLAQTRWAITLLLDELGLYTGEVYQKSRKEVIFRQQREIAELSTPVVKLWDGVLALPIIGTLDSERRQVVMENLLQRIVDHGAAIATIDITGVPTVDNRSAPFEDGRGGEVDGCRLHHQWDTTTDRTNYCPSRCRTKCRQQGNAG